MIAVVNTPSSERTTIPHQNCKNRRKNSHGAMRVLPSGEHAGELQPCGPRELKALAFVNCLRHELCLLAHWLQFNSWRRRHADEKSWRSQFMMRQHQFIYKNEQSKNIRIFSLYSCSFFCLAICLQANAIYSLCSCDILSLHSNAI